jgi:nitrate/TMAO reductase-like tetraheme cytochrome c subunit
MSRSGNIALVVGIVIVLSVMLFSSLSSFAENGTPEETDLEDLQCRDCHGQARFLPSYHRPAGKWKRRHGHKVNTLVKPDIRIKKEIPIEPGHVYECGLCHVDDACRKCHQLNRPKDHTGFWKMRGHGIRARAQRETCANCHNEVFCIRCHKTTKPYNHRGNWKGLHPRAVSGGHTQRCSVCHPRIVTKVHVGNSPECTPCHPR